MACKWVGSSLGSLAFHARNLLLLRVWRAPERRHGEATTEKAWKKATKAAAGQCQAVAGDKQHGEGHGCVFARRAEDPGRLLGHAQSTARLRVHV